MSNPFPIWNTQRNHGLVGNFLRFHPHFAGMASMGLQSWPATFGDRFHWSSVAYPPRLCYSTDTVESVRSHLPDRVELLETFKYCMFQDSKINDLQDSAPNRRSVGLISWINVLTIIGIYSNAFEEVWAKDMSLSCKPTWGLTKTSVDSTDKNWIWIQAT